MNPHTSTYDRSLTADQPMMPLPITINILTPYGMTTLNATMMVPDHKAPVGKEALSAVETNDLIDELKDRVRDLEF